MGTFITHQKSDQGLPLFHKRKRGQALVETVFAALFLILLLLGLIDAGRIIYTKIVLTNAAREGAHYLSYTPTDAAGGKQAAVSEAQNSGVSLTAGQVSTSCSGTCSADDQVTVTAGPITLKGILIKTTVTSNIVRMMIVQ